MESEKYNKLVNIRRKKQIHRYREQTSSFQWGEEEGKGNIKVWEQEVLLGIKQATRIYCVIWGCTVSIL